MADHLLTNPWWVDVFLAPVLALLATILIFMDQQVSFDRFHLIHTMFLYKNIYYTVHGKRHQ